MGLNEGAKGESIGSVLMRGGEVGEEKGVFVGSWESREDRRGIGG